MTDAEREWWRARGVTFLKRAVRYRGNPAIPIGVRKWRKYAVELVAATHWKLSGVRPRWHSQQVISVQWRGLQLYLAGRIAPDKPAEADHGVCGVLALLGDSAALEQGRLVDVWAKPEWYLPIRTAGPGRPPGPRLRRVQLSIGDPDGGEHSASFPRFWPHGMDAALLTLWGGWLDASCDGPAAWLECPDPVPPAV